jgi:ABC-type multidrug transport system ATPase subunit
MAVRGLSPFLLAAAPLAARGVTKRFARGLARSPQRTTAIESIDIDIRPGELIALAGGVGAGKTTLLQCLCGLLKPDSGCVELFGERFPPGWTPPGLAYVPAIPVFYPFLTPLDIVELAMTRNINPAGSRTPEELLASLELDRMMKVKVSALPRELRRRVSIAQALAAEPAITLVDSPAAEVLHPLDSVTVKALAARVDEGAAVIVALREVSAVAFAATRIFLLKDGRTARTFALESFGEPIVAGFPGVAPRIVAERVH